MNKDFTDQLSWEEFFKESKKETKIQNVKPYNRMIAHSKNFFIISGYGAFTQGYQVIITKDFIPSFGLVEEENFDELQFIIKISKEIIKEKFDRKSIIFEHGMCACIGGLDRAHLHIMSAHNDTNNETLKKSINKTLYDRKAGIEYIKFNNYKLENLHDINHFLQESQNDKELKFEVVGKILDLEDIKDLSQKNWPKETTDHIKKGGHYVFFRSEFDETSFLTTHNFQTQFGRQVIFENELDLNKSFAEKVNKIKKNNQFLEVWKWQNCMFEINIIEAVNLGRLCFKDLQEKYEKEFERFEIKTIT